MQPLDAGFIDLPQQLLDQLRRKGDASELGRVLALANSCAKQVDRVVILGIGGSYLGSARPVRAPLPASTTTNCRRGCALGVPRIYFEGNNVDNDALQDLLDLLQITCVDPELREERWGAVVISKSGGTLETGGRLPDLPPRSWPNIYGSPSESAAAS